MSKPPAEFPNERGKKEPCGASWQGSLVVDGRLPGRTFGKAFSKTIDPIVSSVSPIVGQSDADADALRDLIQARINTTRDTVVGFRFAEAGTAPVLDEKQADAIDWLLTHAEAETAAAIQLHDKWQYREYGAFPLSLGDTIGAFPGGDCKTPRGDGGRKAVPYGKGVVGHDGQMVICPTVAELSQRAKDRAAIREHFKDALMHVRCAEYGLWKIAMVIKALDAAAVGDLPLKGQPGTGQAEGPPAPPPQLPHIQRFLARLLPDPDDLPPPEEVGDPGVSPPPEGEGEPEPPRGARTGGARTAVLAAAGVAGGLLLWRSLR